MIEVSWLAISTAAVVITIGNLWASVSNWLAVRQNGVLRRTVARGNVALDVFLLLGSSVSAVLIVPSLLREGDVPVNPIVIAAMCIPVAFAGASMSGRWMRRRVERLVRAT